MNKRTAAWIAVVVVALALSNWSLAYVARSWGVPWVLGYGVSVVFDGVALLCADLALKAARQGDSTFGPGACLLIFGAASAVFNGWHARLAGLPLAASAFYAFPPMAALAVTELQLRHDRRTALRQAGRIADPLPAFGGAMWANKPVAAYQGVRQILAHRLKVKLSAAVGKPAAQPGQVRQDAPRAARPLTRSGRAAPALAGAEQAIASALAEGQKLSKRTAAATLGLEGVSEWQVQQILQRQRARLNGQPA